MNVLIAFLLLSFVVSGNHIGRQLDRRPILLVGASFVCAMGYYFLSVIL